MVTVVLEMDPTKLGPGSTEELAMPAMGEKMLENTFEITFEGNGYSAAVGIT